MSSKNSREGMHFTALQGNHMTHAHNISFINLGFLERKRQFFVTKSIDFRLKCPNLAISVSFSVNENTEFRYRYEKISVNIGIFGYRTGLVRKVRPVNLVFLDYMLFAGEDTLGSLDIWYC